MHEFNIIMECLDDTKFQDHSFEYMGNKITLIVKNTIFYNIYKKSGVFGGFQLVIFL